MLTVLKLKESLFQYLHTRRSQNSIATSPVDGKQVRMNTIPLQRANGVSEEDPHCSLAAKVELIRFQDPSHLDLTDLQNMTDDTLDSLLAKEIPVRIDLDFISRYPLAEHGDLYRKHGSRIKSVEFDQIEPEDLPKLFSIFKNVSQLTLRRVRILVRKLQCDYRSFPRALTQLKLIDCEFGQFTEVWFRVLRESLVRLHLERSGKYKTLDWVTLDFKVLKSLVLINETSTPCECPLLDEFYVKDPNFYNYREKLASIRSLTIGHCWAAIDLSTCSQLSLWNLRHLRIIQSVDPKYKEAIDFLQLDSNLESVDVHYYDISTGEDRPFSKLNEYCIRHILDFLPVEDLVALYDTSTMLRRLVREKDNISFICNNFSGYCPHNEDLRSWFVLGQIVSNLQFSGKQPACLLKLFVKLKQLRIPEIKADYEEVFKNLDATLTSLATGHLTSGENRCLRHLHNIQHFRWDGQFLMSDDVMPQFLIQNIHMQSLYFAGRLLDFKTLQAIRGMKKLKSLFLTSIEMCEHILDGITYPELEELTGNGSVERVSLPLLKKLTVMDIELLERLVEINAPNLRSITIFVTELEMLRFLILHPDWFNIFKDVQLSMIVTDERFIIDLVKGQPMLTKISCVDRESDEVVLEVRSYLKDTNRSILRKHIHLSDPPLTAYW